MRRCFETGTAQSETNIALNKRCVTSILIPFSFSLSLFIFHFDMWKFNFFLDTSTYQNGDKYKGPFENGYMHGENGFFEHRNGDTYKGDFEQDKQHGHGVYFKR